MRPSLGLLVSFPAYPLTLDTLLPDRVLAVNAGLLHAAGHEAHVHDFGTLEVLRELFPPDVKELLEGAHACFHSPARTPVDLLEAGSRLFAAGRRIGACRDSFFHALSQGLLSEMEHADYVCFRIGDAYGLGAASIMARSLRECLPHLPLVAFGACVSGPGAARFLRKHRDFDIAVPVSPGTALPLLAGVIRTPGRWGSVPGVVCRKGSRVVPASTTPATAVRWQAMPDYSEETYPALAGDGKLKIFRVDDRPIRGEARGRYAQRICRELLGLRRMGMRAVFFDSNLAGANHQAAVIGGMAARELTDFVFGRHVHPGRLDADVLRQAREAGCVSVAIQVNTGSHHLARRFYGVDFSLAHARQAIQAANMAGIQSVAGLSYPCPLDDYHTREETLLFVRNSGPVGVTMGLPDAAGRVIPGRLGSYPGGPFRIMLDRADFRHDLSASGTAPGYCGRTAIVTALTDRCPYAGAFADALERAMTVADVAWLGEMIAEANRAACRPWRAVVFRNFAPMRRAVGN